MKIQTINAALARAHKNKKIAATIQDKQKWSFHIKQLKKLMKPKPKKKGRKKVI